jgi:diaminohydroxyphosphoribosylaminopyrimidine deaminase/5-amino-6-(5-phosphoribosylamino)uracil reductase
VHLLRDACDAILVRAGTVLADDPQLTVRLPSGHPRLVDARPPVRVVLDGALRTPPQARLAAAGTLVLTSEVAVSTHAARAQALRERGVELLALPPPSSPDVAPPGGVSPTTIDLHAAMHALGARGLHLLLCEGGATLHGALLAAGLYDEAALYLAPLLLGDEGVPLLRHFAAPAVAAAPWLDAMTVEPLGRDLLLRGPLQRGNFFPATAEEDLADVHRAG